MDAAGMSSFLKIGETIAVEFKRCGNGIENDVYETVCSFLNRFGGDLFLGLLDDGNPKNPIVSSFFRNIGYADQLGSGVRNLFKYSVYYSGKEPQFVEGDVFRIIVPLEKTFLGDSPTQSATAPPDSPTQLVITPPSCPAQSKIASGHLMFREVQSVEGEILRLFALEPGTTQGQLAKMLNANVYSRSQILANLNV